MPRQTFSNSLIDGAPALLLVAAPFGFSPPRIIGEDVRTCSISLRNRQGGVEELRAGLAGNKISCVSFRTPPNRQTAGKGKKPVQASCFGGDLNAENGGDTAAERHLHNLTQTKGGVNYQYFKLGKSGKKEAGGVEATRARERRDERKEGARSTFHHRSVCGLITRRRSLSANILPHDYERTLQLPLRAELRPGAVEPGRAVRGHGRGPAADGSRRH